MGKSYANLRNPDADIGPGDADVRENNREGKVCPGAIRFDFGAIKFDFGAIRFQLYAMSFQVYAIRE